MSIWRLVFKEMLHRKLGFATGLASVAVACASFVGASALLRAHDLRTREILELKETETRKKMAELEDAYRKIMKKLGFNILILPKGQKLADLYADDFAAKDMPEEYVERLASSSIVTINHLLPTLTRKLKWPETGRTILLTGVRGEVPIARRDLKKPLLHPVAAGEAIIGHELGQSMKLAAGEAITLMKRKFTVARVYPERGSKDDITIWIDLAQAQEMLEKKGLINGILALGCHCAGERLATIRTEIAGILPETQVIEFASKALARAEARTKAKETATAALEAERTNRARLRAEREGLAALLVPLVTVACAAWVGVLSFMNVRERRREIGILRAIGVRSRQIFVLFIARAVLTGLVGAAVGFLAGWAVAAVWGDAPEAAGGAAALLDWKVLAVVLLGAPALSALAGRIPAVIAARQDPATVLSDE